MNIAVSEEDYKYLEILNAAAMKAEHINVDGTFVFKDKAIANLVKEDAKRNDINFDYAASDNEFKIENDNIVIYNNFDIAVNSLPEVIGGNLKQYYCYFSVQQNRLIILKTDTQDDAFSFYFSDKKSLTSNIEYSLSNIFFWQKIYESLCKSIADETDTDKSFCINSFEKGKCKFEYAKYDEGFNDIDLRETYNHFISAFESTKLYPRLFKNRCIERIGQQKTSSLKNLISELDEICNKVKVDFEIFVEQIDFDSYIQKYNDKISGFFSQTRDIIEKMLSHIFTLPLTYAGAIFAFDRLKDNAFNFFLFFAMSVYTLFSCGFLLYEFVDTFSCRKNLDKEVRFYTNNSSFLLRILEPNIKPIKIRLVVIRIVCTMLFFIFIGLLIFLGVILFRKPQ